MPKICIGGAAAPALVKAEALSSQKTPTQQPIVSIKILWHLNHTLGDFEESSLLQTKFHWLDV